MSGLVGALVWGVTLCVFGEVGGGGRGAGLLVCVCICYCQCIRDVCVALD